MIKKPVLDHQLFFCVETISSGYRQLYWCLANLRKHYPLAHVLVIIEGENISNLDMFKVNVIYGKNLWNVDIGGCGQLWNRRFKYFLKSNKQYLFRIDSDTKIEKRLSFLPVIDCVFGTVVGCSERRFIQGGFVGLTRNIAVKILKSGVLMNRKFNDYKYYVNKKWLASDDRALKELNMIGVPFYNHPEIKCVWRGSVQSGKYAITHPHKI